MNQNQPKEKNPEVEKELQKLDQVLHKSEHFLVVVHNNPDPDAIASAAALGYLAEKRCKIKTDIAYGGNIGRAENQTMIRLLRIRMKQFGRLKLEKYDRIALVDTQPGAGNHSLPKRKKCHIVIDHHPVREDTKADFVVIKPDVGVTATMLIEWIDGSDLRFPADLATALAYGISSETQDLGRETTSREINAYLSVYTKSSIRKLAQITHPKLTREYFISLAKMLDKAQYFRNLICAHLGKVPSAEIVSEMADLLLRHERIGWSFCTGRFKGKLIISVRSTNPKAEAGKLVKRLVSDSNTVGGHDQLAGGFVPLKSQKRRDIQKSEQKLTDNFASLMGYEEAEWRPLLNSGEPLRD